MANGNLVNPEADIALAYSPDLALEMGSLHFKFIILFASLEIQDSLQGFPTISNFF